MPRHERRNDGTSYRTPRVEIYESTDAVVLKAEMPGVDKESLDVNIDGGELTIIGKRKTGDSKLRLVHSEIGWADYLRVFTLGDELDPANVSANLNRGILTLTLNKRPEILPRKVEIKVE